ncbi:MAG: hypothetical protein M3297_04395 [Thermoproteota archaeon]|nr:hypothetical protein [Thermoproteota archaeon]
MKRFNPRIDEQRTRRIFIIAFYLSAIAMLSICFYALHISAGEYLRYDKLIIGEVLVNTEFPVQGFPKLVTYLMITSVISWFCVTKLAGDRVNVIPESIKSLCQLFVLAIAVIALYEFVYNSILWNSFLANEVIAGKFKPDGISVPYPNPETPWNLIFATKMTMAAFLISAHAFYIISKSKKFTQSPTGKYPNPSECVKTSNL